MVKPLVTIELDEYNKLIEQSKSNSKLLEELGIIINKSQEPTIINEYTLLCDITIEKKKLKDFVLKQYDLNIINVNFKEVKQNDNLVR